MSKALAEAEAIKTQALTELGIARRERLEKHDYKVYLDALAKFRPETVREACRRLAMTPRGEYEPAFPTLGTLMEHCQTVANMRAQLEEQRRLKPAEYPELSPEKKAEILAQFKAIVQKTRMS